MESFIILHNLLESHIIFWIILKSFGYFKKFLVDWETFVIIWNPLESWSPLESFQILWNPLVDLKLEQLESFWDPLESSETLWNNLDSFKILWNLLVGLRLKQLEFI